MTTSGSYDFTINENKLITGAAQLLGIYSVGNVLAASDYSIMRDFLNMAVSYLSPLCNLWVTTEVTHTLTPGTASYTVGTGLNIDTARPSRLLSARRRDTSNIEIPIEVVSRDEYKDVTQKTTQAPASIVYYDPQVSNGVLYVWPTGSTGNVTLLLDFKRPIQDFDSQGNNPDLPKEWFLPLMYWLAVLVAPVYLGNVPQGTFTMATQLISSVSGMDAEKVALMLGAKK